jgi:hypothetical protein
VTHRRWWWGAPLVVVLLVSCTSPSTGSDEVSAAVADIGTDGIGPVVAVVADDGISDDDAATVVAGLPDHLDDIAASAAAGGDISRGDTVELFGALARADQGAPAAEAVGTWVADTVGRHLGTATTVDQMSPELDALAAVVAAASAGIAAGDDELSTGDVETIITQGATESLALVVAEQDGLPTPEPGELAYVVIDAFGGDPIGEIDLRSTAQLDRLDDDDPWPSAA